MEAKVTLWDHFRRLSSFAGREDRASFWPWAAVALGIVMIAGALMTLPMMARMIRATPQIGSPAPPVGFLAAHLTVTLGLAILLYAAAVARRLHDRGRSGAWGLLPLPFLLYASVQSVRMIDSVARGGQPDPTLLLTVAASSIFYWTGLLALIVLLAGPSDPEPNRYGSAD